MNKQKLNINNEPQTTEPSKQFGFEAGFILICPDCGGKAELKDSAIIYGKSYGLAYVCENYPKCDNFVGCHKGTNKPLGTLANAKLRSKRKETHSLFDQLWKGENRERGQAYKFMAEVLDIDQEQAHIALLTFAQCDKLIKAILGAKSK